MEHLQLVESQLKPLPSLGSYLRPYRKWLFVWLMVLILENCVVPLILYYELRYGAHTKPWLVCTLITCIWGFVLYVEYAIAVRNLIYRWSTHRPLTSIHFVTSISLSIDSALSGPSIHQNSNSIRQPTSTASAPSRWYLDASRWMFLVMLTVTLAELVIGTIPANPYIKLLAMVNPSMFLVISLFILLLDVAALLHIRAPFRISSIAKGEFVRPGIYTLLEDVIAVDLHGGVAFRTRFNERWEVSPRFRRLLCQLSILWSLPGLLVSIACTIVIFVTDDDVGFALGWGLPYVWAMSWTAITVVIVHPGLKNEEQ